MTAVIQRVLRASVSIEGQIHGQIGSGLLVLLGIAQNDTEKEVEKMAQKIADMRIFGDENGKMNLSVKDIKGNILLISQFTLCGDASKGNRPSFIKAARPEIAVPLYEKMIQVLTEKISKNIETGIFGADMKVELINDGPVSIILESEKN